MFVFQCDTVYQPNHYKMRTKIHFFFETDNLPRAIFVF